ncbi:MAG: lytic transglycosylase domain-containing protein [Candidatus Woesearchaeota archaeon]
MRIFNRKNFILVFMFLVVFSTYLVSSDSNFQFKVFEEHQSNQIYEYIDNLNQEDEVGFYEVMNKDSEGNVVSLKIYLVNSDGFDGSDVLLKRRKELGLSFDDREKIRNQVYEGLDDYIIHISNKDKILTNRKVSFCLNDYKESYEGYYNYLNNFNVGVDRNCDGVVLINLSNSDSGIDKTVGLNNLTYDISNETSKLDLKNELVELFSKSIYIPRNNREEFGLKEEQNIYDERVIYEYNYNSYSSDDMIFDYERFNKANHLENGFSGIITFPDDDKEKPYVYRDEDKSVITYSETKPLEDFISYSELQDSNHDVEIRQITSLFVNMISNNVDHDYLPSVLISSDASTGYEIGTFPIRGINQEEPFNSFESFYDYMTTDSSVEEVSCTLKRLKDLEDGIEGLKVPYIKDNNNYHANINSLCDVNPLSEISKCKVDSDFNFLEFIYDVAEERDICPISILAFMATESGGRWKANSNYLGEKDSLGLMQISGSYGSDTPLKSNNNDFRIHPTLNIIYGADYITKQKERYHYLGNDKSSYFFGALSYNLGPEYVRICVDNYRDDIDKIYSCVVKNAYTGYELKDGRENILIKNNEIGTIKNQFSQTGKVYEGGSFGYKVMSKYDYIASTLGVESDPSLNQFKKLYEHYEPLWEGYGC